MLGKIKLIQIITRLDKGGSSENVLLTCEKLNKDEYEIILIYGVSQIPNINFQFTTYKIDELVREISPIKDIAAFLKIYKIIKKEKPDIVHTHSSKAGILGRWAAFLLRTVDSELRTLKIFHTPHGHIFYGYYNKLITIMFILIEKITAKITDKLIALTEGEKNESLAYGIGKSEQWVIIHSGVDYKLQISNDKLKKIKKEFGIQDDYLVIGTVARLEPVKGVEYFIDAIKIIIDYKLQVTDCKFLIVGDGSEMIKLKQKVKRLNIEDKVIFTGMREDVPELISIMDIYVQPSLNEGMGKTIVLAQLLGKPVVATKVQGIPSVVLDGKTGILVEPKNPIQLAEAVSKLLKDEKLRRQLGENAKQWVNKIVDGYPQFSVERMIYLLENLYNEVLSK